MLIFVAFSGRSLEVAVEATTRCVKSLKATILSLLIGEVRLQYCYAL